MQYRNEIFPHPHLYGAGNGMEILSDPAEKQRKGCNPNRR